MKSMTHFAEMNYTVQVSDTRDDDSSNAVENKIKYRPKVLKLLL